MRLAPRHDPFPVNKRYRGIYAHGVETDSSLRHLHVSGQVGESPEGDLPDTFRGQCEQSLRNVLSVLQAAEMDFSHLVKLNFFLVRPSDMESLVDVRKSMLDGIRPAITTVFVAGLVSPDWLVETEAVAAAERRSPSRRRWRIDAFR